MLAGLDSKVLAKKLCNCMIFDLLTAFFLFLKELALARAKVSESTHNKYKCRLLSRDPTTLLKNDRGI
jgi:hypothetical protein